MSLKIIVMGTARTEMINEMTGSNSKMMVLILAPTGVAAFNIKGKTIHSGLSMPIFNNTINNIDI